MCDRFGEDHPDVAASLNNLAGLYESQGRYEQVEPLYLRALQIFLKRLGQDHPNTQTIINNFASFLTEAIRANKQASLSNHPMTQQLLDIIQAATKDSE